MYDQRVLVTGNMENIIAALRGMHARGLLRADYRCSPSYKAVEIVVGDDSEVVAYYKRMDQEREQMRERAIQAGAAGNSGLACALFKQSDELLCRYQERSSCVNERPFTLSQNIYGWCVGSMLLMNLDPRGGRFAWTHRGATLEQCIAWGCEISQRKGTTLSFDIEMLPLSPEERAALVRDFGGSEDAVAFLLTWSEREAKRQQEIAEANARCAEASRQRAIEDAATAAFAPTRKAVLDAAAEALRADGAVVAQDRTGLTARGATFNPSFRLTVDHRGWKIVRTDFDGVRKEHSNVAFGTESADVQAAAMTAWSAMKPAPRKGRARLTSRKAS